MSLSDPLFRTLAAISIESKLLEIGDEVIDHADALLRLGFMPTFCLSREADVLKILSLIEKNGYEQDVFVCKGEADNLPFSPNSFDWVILGSSLALHDVGLLRQQLSECERVLRDGGWLYLLVAAGGARNNLISPRSDTWRQLMDDLSLSVAQEPEEEADEKVIHVIYRKTSEQTPI